MLLVNLRKNAMQNASKTQFFLPIPPASHLLLFVVALCLAAAVAFAQYRQISKPKAKNMFTSGQVMAKTITVSSARFPAAVR